MKIKVRKIKHRNKKNLGSKYETAYRLNGKWGKARTYGHNCDMSNHRTLTEMRHRAEEIDAVIEEED